MFKQHHATIDKTRRELLDVAQQMKAEFLSKIPTLIQERVKKKIADNPDVFQHLTDTAISALKTRIISTISEVVKLIDSATDDYILCGVEDLTQEFQSVSRRADGLIAPILEEVGFRLKRKEGSLALEEQFIDFPSYCNEEFAAQLRYLIKIYTEKKLTYRAAVNLLEGLKNDSLAKEALERWEKVQSA
ncbi:MAG: hypothetical protein ACUZ77_05275 [Candidatus Brocadiales bacterium]